MADLVKTAKQKTGVEAAKLVKSGDIVGLGTGSTAAFMIEELGRRTREEGLKITGVPTSFQASQLARQYGIPLRTLDDIEKIDLAIDGADEVDPQKNLIKGGGAAHTREKVIDYLAERFIVIVDDSKLVQKLGEKFPVPIEVIPMALQPVLRRLKSLGGEPVLRLGVKKDGPVITDQGNFVVDVKFPYIEDPPGMETTLNNIPGVVANGIFVNCADLIIVGVTRDGSIKKIE